jgi:hypothetical protein
MDIDDRDEEIGMAKNKGGSLTFCGQQKRRMK